MNRQTDNHTTKQADSHRYILSNKQTDEERRKQIKDNCDRTSKIADRQTERSKETYRQTDRHRDSHTEGQMKNEENR